MPRPFFGSGFFPAAAPPQGAPAFDTLQGVIDAIGTGDLTEGQPWQISWTGDDYVADGTAYGLVRNGVPSWYEPIPIPVLGFEGSSFGAVGAGAVTLDSDGRPILSVGTGATDAIRYDLGFEGRPWRLLRVGGLFIAAGATTAAEQIVEARMSDPTYVNYVAAGLRYFGGWQFIQVRNGASASGIGLSGSPAIGAFAGGVLFDFQVGRGRTFLANPSFGGRLSNANGNAAQATSELSGSAGLGDWNSTSAEIRAVVSMDGAGTASVFRVTSLACEV